MRIAGKLTWIAPLSLMLGCGGMVVVDREGDGGNGGDGEGGAPSTGTLEIPEPPGKPGYCAVIECTKEGASCSCHTACMGPDLRADCALKEDGMVVCECHFDGGYLGLCAHVGGEVCGLPKGCCLSYLHEQ